MKLKISPEAFKALEDIGFRNPYKLTENEIVAFLKLNSGIEYHTTLMAKSKKYHLVAHNIGNESDIIRKEIHDCVGDCMAYMLAYLIQARLLYLPQAIMRGETQKTLDSPRRS